MNRKKVNLRLQPGNIIRGVFRLARGDAKGIGDFPNTETGFSASLAPLIAFPLVTGGLIASSGHYRLAALIFLSRICTVLIPPLIIEFGARIYRKRTTWLLTATALNWSFWLVLPLMLVAQMIAALLLRTGVSLAAALDGAVLILALYGLWFQWFTIRTGLRLRWWQALIIAIVMDVAIAVISGLTFHFDRQLLTLLKLKHG
jgi:hypothetical protein